MSESAPPEGFVEFGLARSRASKRRRPRQHKVFDDLPLSARRNRAVALGWRIRCDRNGAGVFTSHDYLPGSIEWPVSEGGQVHWADVIFLSAAGPRTGRIFNATVHTLAMRLAESIEEVVENAIDEQLSPEDRDRARVRMFLRRIPGKNSSEMVFSPHPVLDSLGGMTVEGARAKWLREHWDRLDNLVRVGESAQFLPGFAFGTGLNLTTAQPNLTVEAVAAAIADFRARGETQYEIPVDFQTQRATVEAMLRGKLWRWDCIQARATGAPDPASPDDVLVGFESNAIRV